MENYRRHPCIDCGKPCDKRAQRCHQCRGKTQRIAPEELVLRRKAYRDKYEESIRSKHICVDCGNPCDRRSKRCMKCHNEFIAHPGRWSNLKSGEHPANWKGGRRIDTAGYVLIYKPDNITHNNRGYILEHRLVWETANQKPIPKGWIIHHLNGIKSDNRISNLVAMPNHKHRSVLSVKAKRIQELESLLKKQGLLL